MSATDYCQAAKRGESLFRSRNIEKNPDLFSTVRIGRAI